MNFLFSPPFILIAFNPRPFSTFNFLNSPTNGLPLPEVMKIIVFQVHCYLRWYLFKHVGLPFNPNTYSYKWWNLSEYTWSVFVFLSGYHQIFIFWKSVSIKDYLPIKSLKYIVHVIICFVFIRLLKKNILLVAINNS